MKLNYDCLRDFLFVIESESKLDENLCFAELSFESVAAKLPNYSKEDIAYAAVLAEESDLIIANIITADDSIYQCVFWRLTYNGHEFLETIRNKSIWNQTKAVLREAGTITIQAIFSTAFELVKAKVGSLLR